jgi:hypothetical protein
MSTTTAEPLPAVPAVQLCQKELLAIDVFYKTCQFVDSMKHLPICCSETTYINLVDITMRSSTSDSLTIDDLNFINDAVHMLSPRSNTMSVYAIGMDLLGQVKKLAEMMSATPSPPPVSVCLVVLLADWLCGLCLIAY